MNHFLKGENRNSGTNRTRPYEANVILLKCYFSHKSDVLKATWLMQFALQITQWPVSLLTCLFTS